MRIEAGTMGSIIYGLFSIFLLTSQLFGAEAVAFDSPSVKNTFANQLFGASALGVTPIKSHEALSSQQEAVYIVYMGGVSKLTTTNDREWHVNMLSQVMGSQAVAQYSFLYSYTKSFNGFAAVINEGHAQTFRGMDGVVFVFKSQTKQLQTTGSWTYLGLSVGSGLWASTDFGNGTIIGMIDTGIWPELESFNDDGFGPIPATWKGNCTTGEQFSVTDCNKKLIGARYYYHGYVATYGNITAPEILSARDTQGHGSHTSSTAAGRRVANASLFGVANGTAIGGAPGARIAVYKVCWGGACADADILAAFDDAITDGVDIISISIAGGTAAYLDSISIGGYHAMENGILVSAAAGNFGDAFGHPAPGSVSNIAPWIFTVGASTISRFYQVDIKLGNDVTVAGTGLNTWMMNGSYPIVYGGNIPSSNNTNLPDEFCLNGTLDPVKAYGKIIICFGLDPLDQLLSTLGSVGYVSIPGPTSILDQSVLSQSSLPATIVSTTDGESIIVYANSTTNPEAIIYPSETIYNTTPAPAVAYFSAVGPNPITPDVLKPDITAPGVDIIAGWSPVSSPSGFATDKRSVVWNIISGTSMSTPHAAGIAALVKAAHPDWSAGAIKSAIMTTATQYNNTYLESTGITNMQFGSGEVNPVAAADPGLVFNISSSDYVSFLCGQNYTGELMLAITGGKETCPKNPTSAVDMNYPTIYAATNGKIGVHNKITRKVTNVGPARATYSVTIEVTTGLAVEVSPSTLTFSEVNEEQAFTVLVTKTMNLTNYAFAAIVWSDGKHTVRVPVGVPCDYCDNSSDLPCWCPTTPSPPIILPLSPAPSPL